MEELEVSFAASRDADLNRRLAQTDWIDPSSDSP